MSQLSSQQVTLLISLKGAPASIVLAFLMVGQSCQPGQTSSLDPECETTVISLKTPNSSQFRKNMRAEPVTKRSIHSNGLGLQELSILTGWSEDQVTRGLNMLETIGMVERHSYFHGWHLTNMIEQLGIPGLKVDQSTWSGSENAQNLANSPEQRSDEQPPLPAEVADDLLITTIINNMKEPDVTEGSINKPPPAAGDHGIKQNETSQVNLPKDLINAYQDTGITLNWRTMQLGKGITSQDVRGVHANLHKRGKGDQTGLLITILEKIATGEARHHSSYSDWNQ